MATSVSPRTTMSRRQALVLAGTTGAGVALSSTSSRVAAQTDAADQQVYFGWVLGSPDVIAVAFDLAASEVEGARTVKGYVCNGLGAPDGIALWFKGNVVPGEPVTLNPPVGEEALTIEAILPTGVFGSFTGADGIPRRYAAFKAVDGAGIYDVTLDDKLNYKGTSTNGSILEATADENGGVAGQITSADGGVIFFKINVLAKMSENDLQKLGLPTAFRDFADVSIVPDSYTAVISPGGSFWLGRSGDIRAGSPGLNIIGLDACEVVTT